MKYNCNLCNGYSNILNKTSIYPNYFSESIRSKYSASLFCNDCVLYIDKDPEFAKDFYIRNVYKRDFQKKKEFLKDSVFKINPEIELIEIFDNNIYYNFKFFIVSQMIKYLCYSIKKYNTKNISDDNFYMLKRNFLSGNLGIDKHQILMWKNPGFSDFREPLLYQVNSTKAMILHFFSYIIIVNIDIFEGFDVEYKEILVNRSQFKCNIIHQSNYLNVLKKYSDKSSENQTIKKTFKFYDNKYT